MALSPADLDRHKRHLLLKEIGGPGVRKLKAASVTIVGAGALGGPCALYLAAAGVGRITLVDDDVVERSNLQRQVQYTEADIGEPKAVSLARRLGEINGSVIAVPETRRFAAGEHLPGDILIDGTDNFDARFALNVLAHQSGRHLVSGAALGWQGQVSVFASGVESGSPCYRCLVPETPPDAETCESLGVVGAVCGMVGTRMALEALKLITGAGKPLIGTLWILDGLTGRTRLVTLRQDPACQDCN
ncbi:MAG: HesA/MoeB/ThiF family protein [Pseudomonadota bacterium]